MLAVLGVNLGTLGFLAEIAQDELFDTLDAVLAGRFRTESRMRLDVAVERDDRTGRPDRQALDVDHWPVERSAEPPESFGAEDCRFRAREEHGGLIGAGQTALE